jgi:hypothetical protein
MILIVVLSPSLDLGGRVLHRLEPVYVQAFFPEAAVEGFDGRIVRRLATSAEVEDDAIRVGPSVHRRADELRSVVAIDPLWQAAVEPVSGPMLEVRRAPK